MKKTVFIFVLLMAAGALTGLYLSLAEKKENLTPPGIGVEPGTDQSNNPDLKLTPPEGAFSIRGIVEGFYGSPWTFAQRKEMFSFMEANHFNTYVYAPKDDPYQRAKWWELYPAAEFKSLKDLVDSGKTKGITFVYSLSPGIPQPLPGKKLTPDMINDSITFSSEASLEKLNAKIQQLHTAGINTLMLSFDDVKPILKSQDQRVYGNNYPKAHIELANKLYLEGQKSNPGFALWFAPTRYYGLKDNSYWQELRKHLNPEIRVIWTGSWVLAKEITAEEAVRAGELLGRKPLIWDNYPVNDYTYEVEKAPRLMLGPLENRSPDLSKHVEGLISNPMTQPESSKIPLSTIGKYLWDPQAYDPDRAWFQTIRSVGGDSYPAFLKFCSYSSSSVLTGNNNKSPFSSLADSFWQDYRRNNGASSENNLREELRLLSNLSPQLRQTVNNQALLNEIQPWLDKLSQLGETGVLALDYLKLGNTASSKVTERRQLQQKVKELKANKYNIGNEIIVFIESCLTYPS